MFRSLSELRGYVDQLIESYGEDVSVASFIFSPADVFYYEPSDMDMNEEHHLNQDDTDEVLCNVGNTDYIYETINEVIQDEVNRIVNRNDGVDKTIEQYLTGEGN